MRTRRIVSPSVDVDFYTPPPPTKLVECVIHPLPHRIFSHPQAKDFEAEPRTAAVTATSETPVVPTGVENGAYKEEEAAAAAAEQTVPKEAYGFPSASPERPVVASEEEDEPLPPAPSPVAATRWKRLGLQPVGPSSRFLSPIRSFRFYRYIFFLVVSKKPRLNCNRARDTGSNYAWCLIRYHARLLSVTCVL